MNLLRLLVSSLTGLLSAVPMVAAEAGTMHRSPGITLYERPNFGGASLEVELDEAILDLSTLRFPNGSRVDDKVSSVQIDRGAQVRIYTDGNLQGEFLELTRSVENLGTMARAGGLNWNDTISSLRVYESRRGRSHDRDPSRTPRIIVFSGRGYTGEAFEIFPGESFANLRKEQFESGADLNDAISSVRVVGSLRVRLYLDGNHRGPSLELTQDTLDLYKIRIAGAKHSWNDRTSSLVVEWVGPPRKLDDEPEKENKGDGPGEKAEDSGTF